MKRAKLLAVIAVGTALGACDGATTGGNTGTSSSDIETFQQLAANVRSAAAAYRDSMMAPGATPASCRSIHDGYDGQVRPWISQMNQMSRAMDDFMDGHGGMSSADMSCMAAAMMGELDHHRDVACTFSDFPSDAGEATRHAGAMISYGAHMYDRCGQMMGGFDGGAWSWSAMMGGCDDWRSDGGMPHDWWDGGSRRDSGMMEDGGMMER